jgi:hypothetical protein
MLFFLSWPWFTGNIDFAANEARISRPPQELCNCDEPVSKHMI